MPLEDILYYQKSTILEKSEYEKIIKEIPLNPIATKEIINELKKVPEGEKPIDLIFVVYFKESKNDRVYTIDAYKSIVNQILTSEVFIPVCFGHQSESEFSYQARQIVGSVIGALLDEENERVFYRIIPDASEKNKDIRRWIKNKQLNSISIWGSAESSINAEGKEIISDFHLRSIDFVPPLTEGQLNLGLLIGEAYNSKNPIKYKENNMVQDNFKIEDVTNTSLQNEFSKRAKDGRISLEKVLGEMNFQYVKGEEFNAVEKSKEEAEKQLAMLIEKAKSLGFSSIDELYKFVEETRKKQEEEKAYGEFQKLKQEVMTEKGLLKDGKPTGNLGLLIGRYAPIKQGMNREEIKKIIDEMIEDKEMKEVLGQGHSTGEAVNLRGEMLNTTKEEKEIIFEI
ncbi:MAG: hypothetical protein ACTTKH_04435 [Treponema sp.]